MIALLSVIVGCASVAAVSGAGESIGFRLSVRRQQSGSVQTAKMMSKVALRGSAVDPYGIHLRDVGLTCVTDMDVGTPPQTIPLVVDMRSPYMAVSTSSSSASPSYNADASNTSELIQEEVSVHLTWAGSSLANLYEDQVADAPQFEFLGTDAKFIPVEKAGGVVGLSPAAGSVAPSVLEQIAALNGDEAAAFGFYWPLGEELGMVILGGDDSSAYMGDFNFLPMLSPDSWAVAVDDLLLGEVSYKQDVSAVLIDPSNPFLLYGPVAAVQAMAESIGATLTSDGVYKVDCSITMPKMIITLGGVKYKMKKDDLVFADQDGVCWFTVIPLQTASNDSWTLGWSFSQKYYVTYDAYRQRVGVALAA